MFCENGVRIYKRSKYFIGAYARGGEKRQKAVTGATEDGFSIFAQKYIQKVVGDSFTATAWFEEGEAVPRPKLTAIAVFTFAITLSSR